MLHKRPLRTTFFILLSLLIAPSLRAEAPAHYKIDGVPRVKQITNYCGPACLSAVLQFAGQDITQEAVGKDIYDPINGSTNGADMLLFARDKGLAAYSWNASIDNVKKKLADGFPVIVLQQNSVTDTSGHYRVLTGFDDNKSKFDVMDPYYDNITELSYSECERLWSKMGHWALLITPQKSNKLEDELDAQNPVVHMDLSFARYKRKNYIDALKEAKLALKLEPGNVYVQSLLNKINRAMSAQAK